MTYGIRAAPYLATKCLNTLAKHYQLQYPLGAVALETCFYVNDCLTDADSLSAAFELKNEITKICSHANIKLRKWCANHPKLLEQAPIEDQEVNLDFGNYGAVIVRKIQDCSNTSSHDSRARLVYCTP